MICLSFWVEEEYSNSNRRLIGYFNQIKRLKKYYKLNDKLKGASINWTRIRWKSFIYEHLVNDAKTVLLTVFSHGLRHAKRNANETDYTLAKASISKSLDQASIVDVGQDTFSSLLLLI
jgi:histidinol phosphatase-like PHP family hydrolase